MRMLVLQGHPHDVSFNRSLAISYAEGARASGSEVRTINLADLDFDPVLRNGYAKIQPLEPDLVRVQKAIEWADHIVVAYPVWWGAAPALLKGFFDRTFLPGWAFAFEGWWPLPVRKLTGKTAHVIVTMDAPRPVYWAIYRNSAHRSVVNGTLSFCGIGPVSTTTVDAVKYLPEIARKAWMARVRRLGEIAGRRRVKREAEPAEVIELPEAYELAS